MGAMLVGQEVRDVRLYFGCSRDHRPPRDAEETGVVVSIAAGYCPVCPEERLGPVPSAETEGDAAWARCGCCDSAWRLEDQGFACRPGRLVEEFE
jgi:hypothetical protein